MCERLLFLLFVLRRLLRRRLQLFLCWRFLRDRCASSAVPRLREVDGAIAFTRLCVGCKNGRASGPLQEPVRRSVTVPRDVSVDRFQEFRDPRVLTGSEAVIFAMARPTDAR